MPNEETRKLFGTDGVRWIANQSYDPTFAMRLAMAIASYFPPGARALVGCDARIANPSIYNAVLSALAASGSKVYDAGLAPTPALQLAVRDFGFDYGVIVTASHNPPEWVGIKVVLSDGIEAPPSVDVEIERIFFESKQRLVSWSEIRSIERFPIVNEHYVESVKKHVDRDAIRRRSLKAVVDCANSVPALTTPRILKELGVKVLTLNCDMGMPYRRYEPTPESLDDLAKVVKAVGADFGLAHDGDGDRAIFIDSQGRFIPGDISATILIHYIADVKRVELPKRVVTAVSTSHFLMQRNVVSRGIEVVWTRVGFPHIARKIKELGAMAGFEDNGGFGYVPHQPVRDGGMTAALMAELLSVEKTSLDTLFDSVEKPVIIRTRIEIPNREKGLEAVEEVKKRYSGFNRIEIDGVKVMGDDFAFLVRVSGTEPIVRVMVEAWSREKAEAVLQEVLSVLREALGEAR